MVLPRIIWKRLPDGRWAHLYNILTTPHWVVEILEPRWGHSTWTTRQGRPLGRCGTNPLPDAFDYLPASPARSGAVRAFYEAHYQQAYRMARRAFPEIIALGKDVQESMGEISFSLPDIIPI